MGLSFWHLLLILGIILLFFGPSRLPKVGSSIGETIRQFKKGMHDGADDVEAERLSSKGNSSLSAQRKNSDKTTV